MIGTEIETEVNNVSEEELDYEDDIDDSQQNNLPMSEDDLSEFEDSDGEIRSDAENEFEHDNHGKHDTKVKCNTMLTQRKTVKGQNLTLDQMTEEQILSNPSVGNILSKLIDEKIEKRLANKTGHESETGNNNGKFNSPARLVKSPSDTTLYAPALRKLPPGTPVRRGAS